uniref:Replication factor A C-terminal domain-containing protein n=1 Tax=Chenopodium quinoa TaxID=63459 RepID=A0A803MDJ1_CHEQI
MKLESMSLDELSPQAKSYKVKVTVIEKGRPTTSPKKGVRFQTFYLADDKRLDPEAGPIVPDYQPIGSISRAIDAEGKYDVIVVVLFVEEHSRVSLPQNLAANSLIICIYLFCSYNNDQPVTVSVWNDLAEKDCERLTNWAAKFQIVGFMSLRPVTRRGFGLTSGMSTRIIHDPVGDRANILKEWTKLDRQARVLKPANALQDERFWLRITIPNADLEKVNAYAGCSICSKRTSVPIGTPFFCSVCSKPDCVFAHMVTFKFEATDGTGSMIFTTFNDDTKNLFGKSASKIYDIKNSVGPTLALSRNNVLQWQLKGLEIEQKAPNTNEKASLRKMDDELNEMLDTSKEIKYSQKNELAVFYFEKESLSQSVDVAEPPKKKLRRKLVMKDDDGTEKFLDVSAPGKTSDVVVKCEVANANMDTTLVASDNAETPKGNSSKTIASEP